MATFLTSAFCPYKGLQPYTEEDRAFFFGRERDQEIIASNLFAASLTVLYGSSGVGKSSVLMAGVVPQLRTMPHIVVVIFRTWQNSNFDTALKQQTLQAVSASVGKSLQVDSALPFDDFVGECATALRGRIFFIFDQFEEYFMYHPASADEKSFDAELARAVNRREVAANFVLALREDSLSRLDRFKGRIPNLLGNMLRLEHLDRESAVNAIRGPLDEYNRQIDPSQVPFKIDDALVDAVIEQVQTGGVMLGTGSGIGVVRHIGPSDVRIETPYLQLVMTRLWEEESKAGSRALHVETFKRLGGAQQIVRTHLDKTMNRLADSERQVAARAFRFLVTPSRTKIAYTAQDLASYAQVPTVKLAPVLQKLAAPDVRVLRSVAALGENLPPMYEIFHDVLTPAVLDWRDRYIDQKRTRTLQMVGVAIAAAFVFVILSSLVAQWNTRVIVSQEAQAAVQATVTLQAAQVSSAQSQASSALSQASSAQAQASSAQAQVTAEKQQANVAQTSVADLQQNAQQQSATQTVVARATANAVATQELAVQLVQQTAQAQAASAATLAAVSQLALRTAAPPSAPGVTSTPEPTTVAAQKTVLAVATNAAQNVKFAVESVSVSVSPETSNSCPTVFTATATIRANQAGTVSYRGEFDDGTRLPIGTVTFTEAGSKTVTYTWTRTYADSGTIRIDVTSPNQVTSNSAKWQVSPNIYPVAFQSKLGSSNQTTSLGCPQLPPLALSSVRQPFEKGTMYWRGDNKLIYVLFNASTNTRLFSSATWKTYADTWDDTQKAGGFFPTPTLQLVRQTPQPQLYEPQRGFGKVWREQLGEPKSQVIGWATAPESDGRMQLLNFENGFVLLDDRNDMRILFANGKWSLP